MANLHDWVGKSILIGVFIICLVTFGVMIGSNYDKTSSEMVGNAIDLTRIESAINQTNTDAYAWKEALKGDTPFLSFGAMALLSLWNTALGMLNVILTMMDLYLFSIANILGVPPLVTGAITTILIISIIWMIFQWVKN